MATGGAQFFRRHLPGEPGIGRSDRVGQPFRIRRRIEQVEGFLVGAALGLGLLHQLGQQSAVAAGIVVTLRTIAPIP
jgi:hypothetical protein